MLKALLKKQFLELNQFYFRSRKTGALRSKNGTIAMIVLYIAIFALLGVVMGMFELMLYQGLAPQGCEKVYYILCALFSVVLGVFGSVFNTYASLYLAKDNDLLLSMPIPPAKLLLVRMTGVYAMGLLYEAIVFIPAMVVPWLCGGGSIGALLAQLVLLLVIGVFVLVLTCALGWVVALLSTKLKNRSFMTVLLSLAFIVVYYIFYYKLSSYIQALIANAEAIAQTMQTSLWPLYQLGSAACGNVAGLLVTILIAAVVFAALMLVMSRSFLRITTATSGERKTAYRRREARQRGIHVTLLRKELRRFTSSSTYMLNAGLGLILTVAVAVFALIKLGLLRGYVEMIAQEFPVVSGMLPVLAAAMVCLAASINTISAPSVALEGKSLWLLQSLPVRPRDVLRAKDAMHFLLNAPAVLLLGVALAIVLRLDALTSVLILAVSLAFIALMGTLGLMLGLHKPNFSWTSETQPVKQSMAVAITMFGGWLLAFVPALVYWPLAGLLSPTVYLAAVTVVLALAAWLCWRWLMNRGAAIFETL